MDVFVLWFAFRRPINPRTVLRRLRVVGIKPYRPKNGYILTNRHKAVRLNWAQEHARWTRRQWGSVVFSDESKFNVHHHDGRIRVFRSKGERFQDSCVSKVNRGGGGSVHVWAGISQFNKTELVVLHGNVTARSYIDNVLRPVLLPFLRDNFRGRNPIFQQDNAPAHRAHLTTNFLRENAVECLKWPALSPDMSPIEDVWDELGRRLRSLRNPPRTVNELTESLIGVWNGIPQDTIANLVLSMRRIFFLVWVLRLCSTI